jgi:hypothetical protein
MDFDLVKSIPILTRTPAVLTALLSGLGDEWLYAHEEPEAWSPFDVLGHLIHGERTDWIPRARMILEHGTRKSFEPFDRLAQFQESQGKSIGALLTEFSALRKASLDTLAAMHLTPSHLESKGIHPEFGEVTLAQLLATWVVHDLSHIAQAAQAMSRQYRTAVGPWRAYLPILGG